MKILLAHSYFLKFDPKQFRQQQPYAPLGTLFAGAYLKQQGFEVDFFDAMFADKPNEIIPQLEAKPDVLVIYEDDFNYLTKMCLTRMREAAFDMIRLAKARGVKVIVHGSDVTDHVSEYLERGADYAILGEGEQTLLELAQTGFESRSVAGLAYLENHEVIETERRNFIENLDELPDPDFSMIDIEKYRNAWTMRHGYFSMNISTTRGCPYHCNWCAKPIYGQIYHSFSPERIARHIKFLQDNFHPDHLWITDDIFGLKPGWLEKFRVECEKLNVRIPYKCQTRADLVVRGTMADDLKRTGAEEIWIGAESGSQKILDAMEKGIKISHVEEATRRIKSLGIRIAYFIQFGYPGELWADIQATRKMILNQMPDEVGISVSYPLPGTKFYERVKDQLKQKANWTDSDDLEMMFSGTYSKSFYRILHRLVHAEYRLFLNLKQRRWAKLPRAAWHLMRYCVLAPQLYFQVSKTKPT